MARKPDVQYIRFVTDGSAARVAEQVPVRAKTRLPKLRKKAKAKASAIYLDPLAFVGILLSCVMLVLMVVNCVQLQDYQAKANAMDDYVDSLIEENARLNDKYRSDISLEDIEEKAVALGLVPIEQVRRITVNVERTDELPEASPMFGMLTGVTD